MTSLASQVSASPLSIKYHGQVFCVLPREHLDFWRSAESGQWDELTPAFIKRTTNRDTYFVDIGAWIGPLTLFAGTLAKKVLAIEPDPVIAAVLQENVRLNDLPIEVRQAGIHSRPGQLALFSKTGTRDNMASSLGNPTSTQIEVPGLTFDDIAAEIGDHTGNVVVKMDVEGHEFEVGQQLAKFAKRFNASLTVSVHGGILYRSLCHHHNVFAARRKTFETCRKLIDSLRSVGTPYYVKTRKPVTLARLASFVFLRATPKNFTVEVVPSPVRGDAPLSPKSG